MMSRTQDQALKLTISSTVKFQFISFNFSYWSRMAYKVGQLSCSTF